MAQSVSLRGVERQFDGAERAAVSALSLELPAGKTLCLVGPSGCGKSTTLRMIAGLEHPDAGSIHIGDRDMRGVPPQARDVAMVFQGFALYPHMTAREIIAFPLKMRKVPPNERERQVAEAAELLEISHLLDRRPEQLSGGERQRVAMGRAIVRRPEVFLFDEPLSNLDAALRGELRVELGRLLKELGATAVYVTHDQVEAMTLGDQIAVMRAGKLEQLGTPRELYERPTSEFVAAFFGSPSMALCHTEPYGDGCRVGTLLLPAPFAGARVGIRAEAVHLGEPGPGEIGFQARVRARESLGAETQLELELQTEPSRGADAPAAESAESSGPHRSGSRLPSANCIRVRAPGFVTPEVGSSVSAALDPSALHWFSAETGLRLDEA